MKDILKTAGNQFMTITDPPLSATVRYPSDGVGGVQALAAGNVTENAARVLVGVLTILSATSDTVTVDILGGTRTLFTGTLAVVADETLEIDFGMAQMPADLALVVNWTAATITSTTLAFNQTSRYGA